MRYALFEFVIDIGFLTASLCLCLCHCFCFCFFQSLCLCHSFCINLLLVGSCTRGEGVGGHTHICRQAHMQIGKHPYLSLWLCLSLPVCTQVCVVVFLQVFEAYSEPQERGGRRGHPEFTFDEEEVNSCFFCFASWLLFHLLQNYHYIDRHIYLNLFKSAESATRLKALKPAANGRSLLHVQIFTRLFTFVVQKYIYPSVII